MDNSEFLDDFFQQNKNKLISYKDVSIKMTKFSFSCPFYYHRKILPKYLDENNFLFGFEFGVCVLKDKLLYLGDKLWIHEDFKYLKNFKIDFNQKKIFREKHQIKINDENQLKIFNSLLEILSSIDVVDENKLSNRIKVDNHLINDNLTFDYKIDIEKKYSEKNIEIDISEIISDWYLNFSSKYQSNLVTKEYILQQNKILFSSKIWKSDVIKDSLNDPRFYGDIKFGINSGILFIGTRVYFIEDSSSYIDFNLNELKENTFEKILKQEYIKIEDGYIKQFYDFRRYNDGGMGLRRKRISSHEISLLTDIVKLINKHIKIYNKIKLERKRVQDEMKKNQELKRIDKLNIKKNNILSELDKDGNGEIDLIDSDSFNKLISLHQKNIIDVDKSYIQKFVKISLYIKNKKLNIQSLFKSITKTKNEEELNESLNLLKNQIHTYDLLIFHSINMVTSLIESDLITFYEIYECFDQLGIFNSNWENDVMSKLTDIGSGLNDLLYRIYQMENKIVSSINNLSYVTQDSFKELNISVNNQLSSINSSIKFNNLLTGIQTYQMYRINQNTKRIN